MLNRLVSDVTRLFCRHSKHSLQRVVRLTTLQYHTNSRFVQQLAPKTDDGQLHITWDNGSVSRYPFVYLRDICQCSECFHESSKQRSFDSVAGLNDDLATFQVDICSDGKQIQLRWPDNHVTTFSSDWLFERRLPEEVELQLGNLIIDKTIHLWGHQMSGNIPSLNFNDVINSKSSQIQWLELIHSYGITLLKDAPHEPGQVHKLGETLGFLKEMWFGKSQQIINSIGGREKQETRSPQSSSPYDEYRGGLYLIHCQKHVEGSGGDHTFVDGFKIAQDLQDNDPDAFDLLCTSPILYHRRAANKNTQFDMRFSHPVIRLDNLGHLSSIVYNNINRASFTNVTPDEIYNLYQSYYKLTELTRDMQYTVKHKLQAGDIMTYHCDRVLSGRIAFELEVKGTEIFESAFSDKDMTLSRRRTLKASLEMQVD